MISIPPITGNLPSPPPGGNDSSQILPQHPHKVGCHSSTLLQTHKLARISKRFSRCPTACILQARTCLLFLTALLPSPSTPWLLLFLQQKELNPLLSPYKPRPACRSGGGVGVLPARPSAKGTFQLKLKPPAAHVGLHSALTVLYGNPDTLSLPTIPWASV